MADSQENKQKEQNDVSEKNFMIEKIKERPVNKKKLLRRTLITVSMAVIFGLVACFTFLVLEPVISNWLYPEEEPHMRFFEGAGVCKDCERRVKNAAGAYRK